VREVVVTGQTFSNFAPILAPVESGRWYRAHFCVLFDIQYDVGQLGSGDRITVPAGFVIDGASVPRLLEWFFGRYGRHLLAAIVHDWLYHAQTRSRAESDRIFHEYMIARGVPESAAWAMWAGVRAGGWWGWGKRWLHRRWYNTRNWPILGGRRRAMVSHHELHYLRFRAQQYYRGVEALVVD
jgi:hypothetical protein